jgi:DNA polymerase III epsilon subunit-like protein
MNFVFFDLETTSADPTTARIVQAAFDPPPSTPLTFMCNPGCPIEPGATNAHGITNAYVEDLPGFGDNLVDPDRVGYETPSYAEQVWSLVKDAVLVGYNCRRFDTPILHRELKLAGLPGLKTDAFGEIVHPEIDLYLCWSKLEPRTLTGALDRFAVNTGGQQFEAHDAWEDTRVLDPLMHAMLGKFIVDVERMMAVSSPEDEIDRDGKIKRDDKGVAVIGFGKHVGSPLTNVPRDYLRWITDSGFSESTKAAVRRFLGTGTL